MNVIRKLIAIDMVIAAKKGNMVQVGTEPFPGGGTQYNLVNKNPFIAPHTTTSVLVVTYIEGGLLAGTATATSRSDKLQYVITNIV